MVADTTNGTPSGVAYEAHPTAVIEPGASIGGATQVWHYSHVRASARIGARCMIGFACYVDGVMGDGCRIQNHVSIFRGVVLGSDVFVGPGAGFTNVKRPRAHARAEGFEPTTVGDGASIGANATIVCGVAIGAHAMVAAGATVTRDVPAHALVAGTPARVMGWVCRCGAAVTDAAPWWCGACDGAFTAG